MRTAKQLCKTDPTPTEVDGVPVAQIDHRASLYSRALFEPGLSADFALFQRRLPSAERQSLPYYEPLADKGVPVWAAVRSNFDPYASTTQSRNLRVIETTLNPKYKAKNDTLELNADYNVTPALTFTSQTGYNQDFLWSTEDYNRFNTTEGAFFYVTPSAGTNVALNGLHLVTADPNGLGRCAVEAVAPANAQWAGDDGIRRASRSPGAIRYRSGSIARQ